MTVSMLHALGRAAKPRCASVHANKGAAFAAQRNAKISAKRGFFQNQVRNALLIHAHPACARAASGLSCLACEFSGSGTCKRNSKRPKAQASDASDMKGLPSDIRPMHCKKTASAKSAANRANALISSEGLIIGELEHWAVMLADGCPKREVSSLEVPECPDFECEDQQPRSPDGKIIEPWDENQCGDIYAGNGSGIDMEQFRFAKNSAAAANREANVNGSAPSSGISLILIVSLGDLSSIQTAKTAKKIFDGTGIKISALPVSAANCRDPAAIFDLPPEDAAKVVEGRAALIESSASSYARLALSRARALSEGFPTLPAAAMKQTDGTGQIRRAELFFGTSEEIIAAAERFAQKAIEREDL